MIKIESDYLIVSNRKKCHDLLVHSQLEDEDIIEILISLHTILEVGLNTLFRHIILMGNKSQIDQLEIIENFDRINFIDKIVFFVYCYIYNYGDRHGEAAGHRKIVSRLKDFSGVRNQLLHGHSISKIFNQSGLMEESGLRKKIELDFLQKQLSNFHTIMLDATFFVTCLESSLTDTGKNDLITNYLDTTFLPVTHIGSADRYLKGVSG